jgi:hypothetical protein
MLVCVKTSWNPESLIFRLGILFLAVTISTATKVFSQEAKGTLNLPGLIEVHRMVDKCDRVVIAGSLMMWSRVRDGKYKHIEFESRNKEFRDELQKWLTPKRWSKIEKDQLQTFAAGTVLAIDLYFEAENLRRRVVFVSGQLSVGHEAWIETDVPGFGTAGFELASLLARPEYVKQVVDMTEEEAMACIAKNRKPWEDPRFKGINNDPKWKR